MPALALSIPALARTAGWRAIKKTLQVTITVETEEVTIDLAARPTPTGHLYHLVCPACGARRRDLYLKESLMGCRGCLKILYPDQTLSSSSWNRQVVRPARQVARIEGRLKGTPDGETRRRLESKRRHLVDAINAALGERELRMEIMLEELAG